MGSGTQCSEAVRAALESVAGAERVEVKLDKKWAEVFVAKDAEVSDEALKEAVAQLGKYNVVGID